MPLYPRSASSAVLLDRAPADPPWDVRCPVFGPGIVQANDQALEALAGGAQSLLVALGRPGQGGVAVGGPDDLASVLDGVLLDVAPVALDAGFVGPWAAEWLATAARAAPAAPLAFHLDPLGAFAAAGVSAGPIEAHLAQAARRAAELARRFSKATLFVAGGLAAFEAGAPPAAELAAAIANAAAYARALIAAGLDAREAFGRIVVSVAVDDDCLVSIVKIRAARLLFAKLGAAFGVAAPARIEARSGARGLTRAEPWTNLVRLTIAAFAAVAGGADAVVLGAFTDPLGAPAPLARRLARNTQLILMHEAHLGAVADPFAGAGAVEQLSSELAGAAWRGLQAIESAGGAAEALRGGWLAGQAKAGVEALRRALAAGELRLLGVTHFAAEAIATPDVQPRPAPPGISPVDIRLPGQDSACPALEPISLEDLAATI